MSSLPTISLALIAKNEEKNLPRLLESVKDCFHEIILVDTGSTDKTKEIALKYGCKVYDFEWVNSFCKARNFAFSKCTQDYICWFDCDDELHNREAFIQWRDTAMHLNGAWLATYHYAVDEQKKPIISFVRERVFRRSLNPVWRYDLHEGVIITQEMQPNIVPSTSWAVNHMRDAEDIKADKSRNIKILEEIKDKDARLMFYYGKELYEIQKPFDAISIFDKCLKMEGMEAHDKILGYQYASYAAMACFDLLNPNSHQERGYYFDKCVGYCIDGLKIDSNRAEFYVAAGDMYLKTQQLVKAIPYFAAAKHCLNNKTVGSAYEGAIYSFLNCYGELPCLQLAKIYANIGDLENSKRELLYCIEKYKSKEAQMMIEELERLQAVTKIDNNQEQTEDIVFSTPPFNAYEFDEELYKTKPMGGSETALIQMAKFLKEKTGREVLVYNQRDKDLVATSGVKYLSNTKINEYLSKKKPRVHIAWRHNIKLTNAKTYLWCHDLMTQGCESVQNFDKMLCLSDFHKNYVQSMQGIPDDKLILSRNGITPEKFSFKRKEKNPNKFVFMSSPDRGLGRAMKIMDKYKEINPNAELHVYYGIEGLKKYNRVALHDKLQKMMSDRPYVKYHGFTEQNKMYQEVSDAAIWLNPVTFIESFCITALEMLALGIYPVTRPLGAIKNTLADAVVNGQATFIDNKDDVLDQDGVEIPEGVIKDYVGVIDKVCKEKKWECVSLDLEKHSWESVADDWCNFMELN